MNLLEAKIYNDGSNWIAIPHTERPYRQKRQRRKPEKSEELQQFEKAFTKSKGVTPYRYLQAIRVGAAQKLLQQGWAPIDAALQTGFSDQSHFTNYFQQMIGLTPGAYREMFAKKQSRE